MDSEHLVDINVQVTLVKRPTKEYPQHEDVFQIKYVPPQPTDTLKEGQVIVRNLFLSVDATMRVWISGVRSYMQPIKPGDIMRGIGIGEVIYSLNPKFKVGDKLLGLTYWQKYSVLDGKGLTILPTNYQHYQHFLGVLGISGLTAYFGLQKIGQLKPGEIVVVSTAAGAVGQIAVQLAKLAGCVVCGIAGSDQKCDYVKSLGADHVINYKKQKLSVRLKEFFPNGIDVYFDNVGGEMLDELLMHIRENSRVIACGTISSYNDLNDTKKQPYRIKNYSRIIIKRALIQGFLYFDYAKEFTQATAELAVLVQQGKLKFSIDYHDGVEEAPRGLKNLLMGTNKGKVIIRVNNQKNLNSSL